MDAERLNRKREGARAVKKWSYGQLRKPGNDVEWTVNATWNKQMTEVDVRVLNSKSF